MWLVLQINMSRDLYVRMVRYRTFKPERMIFTVLAFIYVPLNLATSILRMNTHQLNQNGQDI